MELKPNMYVRFKDKRDIQYIRKITEIPKDNRYASIYLDKEANYSKGLSLKNIIKASFNIIDLIEAGDYVNGSRVMYKISNGEDISFPYEHVEVEEDEDIGYERNVICYKNEDIKDVVTKEQFNSMKYEVGE